MLTEMELDAAIQQLIDDNPMAISLNAKQVKEIKDMYYRLSNENRTKAKNRDEQLSMVSAIGIAVNDHTDANAIYNRFADNKHMSYFDEFLADGERGNIQEALTRNKLPTDILKGIRKNTDYTGDFNINGNLVVVNQVTDVDDDGYRYVSEFTITVNGEEIYNFKASTNVMSEKVKENFLEKAMSVFNNNDGDFYTQETIISRKVNTPDYSYSEEAFIKQNGDIGTRRRYAKGTVIDGIKVGGRFIPNVTKGK